MDLIFPKKLLTFWFILLEKHLVTAMPHQTVNCVCLWAFLGFGQLLHAHTHTQIASGTSVWASSGWRSLSGRRR